MDSNSSSSIVPSNAPAIAPYDNFHRPLPVRVLGEATGNGRRAESFENFYRDGTKPESRSPAVWIFRGLHISPETLLQYIRATRDTPRPCVQNICRQIQQDVNDLMTELEGCEDYKKYRSRQPKQTRTTHDQKWPDELEDAFFLALVVVPPMGRAKAALHGKSRGRNELIAEFIEQITGTPRDRKQVSSHIQVLKDYVKCRPRIMKYLSISKRDERFNRSRQYASELGTIQRIYTQNRHCRRLVDSRTYAESTLPSPLSPDTSTQENRGTTWIEPSSFEMFVRHCKEMPQIHSYTKLSKSARKSDYQFPDDKQWQKHLPMLARMHNESSLDCNLILFDVSLSLRLDSLPPGAELGISFDFSSDHDLTPYEFDCTTRIYDGDKLEKEIQDQVGYNVGGGGRLGNVPFGSQFWAHKFVALARSRVSSNRYPTPQDDKDNVKPELTDHVERLRRADERVRDAIRRLSAVQEFFAWPKGDLSQRQRILVTQWRFEQAHRNEPGQTTWRKLFLPQPQRQDSMSLLATQQPIDNHMPQLDFNFDENSIPEAAQTFDCSISTQTFEMAAQHQLQTPRTLQSPIQFDNHLAALELANLSNSGVIMPYPALSQNGPQPHQQQEQFGFSEAPVTPNVMGSCPENASNLIAMRPDAANASFTYNTGHVTYAFDPYSSTEASRELQAYAQQDVTSHGELLAPHPVHAIANEQMQAYAEQWGQAEYDELSYVDQDRFENSQDYMEPTQEASLDDFQGFQHPTVDQMFCYAPTDQVVGDSAGVVFGQVG